MQSKPVTDHIIDGAHVQGGQRSTEPYTLSQISLPTSLPVRPSTSLLSSQTSVSQSVAVSKQSVGADAADIVMRKPVRFVTDCLALHSRGCCCLIYIIILSFLPLTGCLYVVVVD